MNRKPKEYDDIPGTYVFDFERSHDGYHLNMFCMSLLKSENRKEFLADEGAYLDKFPITPEQRQAVLDRDWLGMVHLGGNIYYTSKLGATDGRSFQYLAGKMCGETEEGYRDLMLGGGRTVEGNRSLSDAGWSEDSPDADGGAG
jgi:protocatechuate 4,5-dioxygenase alpha chain